MPLLDEYLGTLVVLSTNAMIHQGFATKGKELSFFVAYPFTTLRTYPRRVSCEVVPALHAQSFSMTTQTA